GDADLLVAYVGANPRFRVSGLGEVRADGAFTGGGADFAEFVSANESAACEPGDVMVVSEDRDRAIRKSTAPYSTAVAGIHSTKPCLIGRSHQYETAINDEIPLAITGIVPCKVTAENGPIHRGDLLVTSSTPGHAMKATDKLRMIGAVVGKAFGNLESGEGVIEVLVTLK
ncbi:MAG: hypothetical protein GW911_25830, partial [Armatimonadetes bacterium]|nr:hypothetical protein [Armatimonadota bacterium]